jgi:hypothetical protein
MLWRNAVWSEGKYTPEEMEPRLKQWEEAGQRWSRPEEYWCRQTIGAQCWLIEIKPIIGDDYPAVLRQMRAFDNIVWKKNGAAVFTIKETTHIKILYVGSYTGQGATREQFVATFASAGIKVVFKTDR